MYGNVDHLNSKHALLKLTNREQQGAFLYQERRRRAQPGSVSPHTPFSDFPCYSVSTQLSALAHYVVPKAICGRQ